MGTHGPHSGARRRGVAIVAALFLLMLFASLGVAFCCLSSGNVALARNHRGIQAAAMQAESGLAFLTRELCQAPLPIGACGQEALDALADHLSDRLDGTATLGGQDVGYDGTRIVVPAVAMNDDRGSFGAEITMVGWERVRLRVTGTAHDVTRRVAIDLDVIGGHPVFGFGIASKGPISLEDNVQILGASHAYEANLFSAAPGVAFRLTGDLLCVEGDIYAAQSEAEVSLSGSGTIGGEAMNDPAVMDHVHIGEGEAEFPLIDTAPFEPLATSIVDANTDTSGTKTFNNIRIKAGADPTFIGGVKINGVVFIEAPNRVTFGDGTKVTGVIATAQPLQPGSQNEIKFENNTQNFSVEELPELPMFEEVRQLTGSFILAPGFRVKFENESGVISGIVAAEHVRFENSFNGTLLGGIISYGTDEMMAENNSRIVVDRSDYYDVPAGFNLDRRRLLPVADSYLED